VRKITKNILFVFSGDVLSRVLGFFATIWLARVLGTYGFGEVSFAFTFLGYALLLVDPGLSNLGTREVAKAPLLSRSYIDKIIPLRFILAIAAFIIITVLTFLIPAMVVVRPLIILYCLSVFPYAFSVEWFFRGIEDMKYIGISVIIVSSFYLSTILFFVRSYRDINLVPFFWFAGGALSTLFLGLVARRKEELKRGNPQLETGSWGLLRQALPIGIGIIMTQVYFNFDITMLGFMKGTRVTGLYTAAYKLLMFLLLIDRVFSMVILPLISRYYKESKEKLAGILSLAAKAVVTLVLPISVGGTILALPIMRLIYGEGYTSSSLVFQILIWTLTITTIGSIYTQGLVASGREKKYAIAMMTGTVANIILNIIMIPKLGMVGAAIATVFSEVVMVLLTFRAFNRVVKVQILPYIVRPAIASAVMCLSIYLLRMLNVILLVFIGAIIYLLFLYIMRGITRDDIRLVMGK
jgi:O-antigen/teichoic acid export membrane protein